MCLSHILLICYLDSEAFISLLKKSHRTCSVSMNPWISLNETIHGIKTSFAEFLLRTKIIRGTRIFSFEDLIDRNGVVFVSGTFNAPSLFLLFVYSTCSAAAATQANQDRNKYYSCFLIFF